MAHEWSRLLLDVESRIVPRSRRQEDQEEEHRRPGGAAAAFPASGLTFSKTGFATKARTANASSGQETIARVLRPHQSTDAQVISLVSKIASRANALDEEELRRGGGGGSVGRSGAPLDRSRPRAGSSARAQEEAVSRAAVASGAQPVVIKVTSTVSSRASAAGLINYLGTREIDGTDGAKSRADIPIQDQDGHTILSGEQRADLLRAWVEGFREGYAVNSVATVSIIFEQKVDDAALHAALNCAFGEKPFLYQLSGNEVAVFGVTDLPARQLAAALKAREKGSGSTHAAEKAERAFASSLHGSGVVAAVTIEGAAASETSARYFLEKFLRSHGDIATSSGERVQKSSAVKPVANKIWEEWSSHIRTVAPRNAFHVIFSAREGTDAPAMTRAVRDFLSEQVPGHKWITAYHPDTGHVHVHAMISARDDIGKPLRFTKPELYAWREAFAAKTREHGIAMVATRRADFAAGRPYDQAQVGAYERGRADPRYLEHPTVKARVESKRAGVIDRESMTNGNLALAPKWRASAQALRAAGADPEIVQAANRFAAAAGKPAGLSLVTQPKGFLLLTIEIGLGIDRTAALRVIGETTGATTGWISSNGSAVAVLAPAQAGVSKIEREISKMNDGFGPGGEMQRVVRQLIRRLSSQGLTAHVEIEAAGSARDGNPTPWLAAQFESRNKQTGKPAVTTRAADRLKTFIKTIKERKEKTMAMSLEQFDERVARANKSMERLEGVVDSSVERQAVEEMRREVSALFAEQRRDIEVQQVRSAAESSDNASTSNTTRTADVDHGKSRPVSADPSIAAQQQAIAQGRAERASKEQTTTAKTNREHQRQEAMRRLAQENERQNGRDGAER